MYGNLDGNDRRSVRHNRRQAGKPTLVPPNGPREQQRRCHFGWLQWRRKRSDNGQDMIPPRRQFRWVSEVAVGLPDLGRFDVSGLS